MDGDQPTWPDGTPKDPDYFPDGVPRSKPPKELDYPPLKKDIPFIKCQVCQRMAQSAFGSVQTLVQEHEAKPKKPKGKKKTFNDGTTSFEHKGDGDAKLLEDIDGVMDRVCDVESKEGSWMAATDIVKQGEELKLIYIKPGTCRRECRTMARACEQIVESIDEEIAQAMHKAVVAGQSVGMAAQRVCNKLTKVCKKGATPPFKGTRKNEDFWPFTDEDVKFEMAKKLFEGSGNFQRVNNPVRKGRKSRDDDGKCNPGQRNVTARLLPCPTQMLLALLDLTTVVCSQPCFS